MKGSITSGFSQRVGIDFTFILSKARSYWLAGDGQKPWF
jgi:hypothetical protein